MTVSGDSSTIEQLDTYLGTVSSIYVHHVLSQDCIGLFPLAFVIGQTHVGGRKVRNNRFCPNVALLDWRG